MTIRIASYNLWNGASDTFSRLTDFAKEQAFEVLCLQEVNGWQDNDFAKLKDFADRAEYTAHQFGNSNSEYKLATLSTLPITFQNVHVEGFWHCAIETHVEVDGQEIVIINLHLDPWKEDPRLHEIERLFELIDLGKPTVIVGDFNSISRADNYPPEFLKELQKRKIAKYGQTELDFRVTDFLTAAGFVDVAAQLKRMDPTVPTPYNTDEEYEVPARIDYVFVSANLAPLVQDFSVIKNESTDKISDHYPITLTLGTEIKQQEEKAEAAAEPEPAPEAEAPAETVSDDGSLHVDHSDSEEPAEPQPALEPEKPEDKEDDEPHNTATEGEIKLH
jgi:exodeoxyribonuclease III